MIVDFPEIKELDINPLVVSGDKVIALDARIIIDENVLKTQLSEFHTLLFLLTPPGTFNPWCVPRRKVSVTAPIRPEDEPMEHELIAGLSPGILPLPFLLLSSKIFRMICSPVRL